MSVTHVTDEELRLQRRVRELEEALTKVRHHAYYAAVEYFGYKLGLIRGITEPYAKDVDDEEPT